LQRGEVARPVAPKPVVVANHHGHGLDAIAHQAFGILPRGHAGKGQREGVQDHIVESGVFQQSEAFVQGVQKFQPVVFGVEHRPRVRVET